MTGRIQSTPLAEPRGLVNVGDGQREVVKPGDGDRRNQVLAGSRAARGADQAAITATVCAAAGYYTERALRPPPPGLTAARTLQAAHGRAARQWLAKLLG